MYFNLSKYVDKINRMGSKIGVIGSFYDVHRGPGGRIQGIHPRPDCLTIILPDGFGTLYRTEKCEANSQGLFFPKFTFHLNPTHERDLSIRVDKTGSEERAHVHPDVRHEEKYGGHRLYYPENTHLDIRNFCFLYFIVMVLLYRATKGYPLEESVACKCNELIGRMRRQVEL